ncbi:hypothetical protein D3C85_493390 [compost metagenome]
MSINFAPTKFGSSTNNAAPSEDRPKAEFWINLGYESDHTNEETGKPLFISLPQGIPLDTQEHLPTNMSNAQFAAMRSAQNDLLDQLTAHAQHLQPGEDCFVNVTVQIRRVKAPSAPINPENNPLIKKLAF